FWVEALSGFSNDVLHGFFQWEGRTILTVRCKSVEAVNHCEDSRTGRNFLPAQSARITIPIPPLVVGAHNRNDRIRELHPLKDFRTNERMDLHALEFFGSQPPGLGDDVLRDGQLADIMKNCGRAKSFEIGFRQAHFLSNGNSIDLHAAAVDRKSTRLNSSHVAISYAVFCLKKKK